MGGVPTRRRLLLNAASLTAFGLTAGAAAARQPFPTPPAPSSALPPSPPPQPLRRDQVDLIVKTLQEAETHGFRQGEFLPANLLTLMASKDPADRRSGDALLRATIVRYARAQHGLRITNWPKNWALRPAPYDAEADFNFAVAQDKLASWIDTLPPPFDRYRVLRTALARYQIIVDQGGWPTIEEGPVLKQGATGDRVLALKKRLEIEEPSLGVDIANPDFDQATEDALKFYQRRNGFDTTGVLGPQTLEAINIPAASRVLQIEANMERWRWAPRLWPATRIEVNIAAAEMTYWVENAIAEEMRAAPGRPDDQTPMLTSEISSVVLNPPWNLPAGIAEKEYYPKERAHPGYLEAHGFRVITNPDGSTRLQQASGPKSALGQIKFDFPNPFAVYLHDTPSHAAFGHDSRAVSHGCVRLERPFDLANKLFAGNETWTPDHIQDVVQDAKTVRVSLDQPVPVFLLYFTVYPDVKGRMDFRNDIYDWDSELLRLIDAAR